MALHRSHSNINVLHPNYGSPVRPPSKPGFALGGEALSRHSTSHFASLVDDRGGNFEQYRKSEEELKTLPKKLRRFYEAQNEQFVVSLPCYCIAHLQQTGFFR
jgi:hypothetical protein